MIYLSWAAFYEGNTDRAYFDLLIPRVMEEIIDNFGLGYATIPPNPAIEIRSRQVNQVAAEVCAAKDALYSIFIHADTGGRALQGSVNRRSTQYCNAMHSLCEWPSVRCVPISPCHEVEAWVLADPIAVTGALGFGGTPESIGLPPDATSAERLVDPKADLSAAAGKVRGRRQEINPNQLFAAIAQRQRLSELRRTLSFTEFETSLKDALLSLGCLDRSKM